MKKNWSKIVLWAYLTIFGLGSQSGFSRENSKHMSKTSELTFLTPLDDLFFDDESIMLNVEGLSYSVHSLQKIGDQWFATVNHYLEYCPKGHPMCGNCHLCHKPDCWYYIRPCKLWESR